MKVLKRAALLLLGACLALWLGALAGCEYDSYRYAEQFREIMVHDISGKRFLEDESLKVLRYGETEAEIYAVNPYNGCLYWFERTPGQGWTYVDWDVVWSTSGTADRYVFPYIRLKGLLGGRYQRR